MHVHASALDAFVILAYMIIIGAAWRTIAANKSESALGKGMAFIY